MDRFEEIKEDYNRYGNMPLDNTNWLISNYERLRKDLQCYGSHANTCDSAYKHSGGIRAKCTCGFDEALKE